MEEETELHPVEPLPQECWQHHEVVIMNPDEIVIRVDHLENLIGKVLVCRHIGLKQSSIIAGRREREWQKRVKQRPQMVLAEAMVEPRQEIRVHEDRYTIEGLKKCLRHQFLVRDGDLVAEAANEDEVHVIGMR